MAVSSRDAWSALVAPARTAPARRLGPRVALHHGAVRSVRRRRARGFGVAGVVGLAAALLLVRVLGALTLVALALGVLRRGFLLARLVARLVRGLLAVVLAGLLLRGLLLARLLRGLLARLLRGLLARLVGGFLAGLLGGLGLRGRRRGRRRVAALAGLVVQPHLAREVEHLLPLEGGGHDVAPDVGGVGAAGDVLDPAEGAQGLLGAVLAGLEHAHGGDQLRGEAHEPGGAELLGGAGLAGHRAAVHGGAQAAGGALRRRALARDGRVDGDLLVHRPGLLGLVLVAGGAVGPGHRLHDVGVAVHAAGGDGRVDLRHLRDRRRGGAQHVRGIGGETRSLLRQAELHGGVPGA